MIENLKKENFSTQQFLEPLFLFRCQVLEDALYDGHHYAETKSRPKGIDVEMRDYFGSKHYDERIDHEKKKSEGKNGNGQCKDNHDRFKKRIKYNQHCSNYDCPTRLINMNARNEVTSDEHSQSIYQKPEDEIHGANNAEIRGRL